MPQDEERSDHHIFGELLGLFYTRAGLTQEELARRVHVTSAAVRNWLRGGDDGGHGISVGKLRSVIEVLFHAGAFAIGDEEAEAKELWISAETRVAFDERWFRQLVQEAQSNSSHNVQKGLQGSEIQSVQRDDASSVAPSVFFFNTTIGLPDPKEFYGRERERDRLVRQTYRQQSTSIVGPNKIGKTWLLDYLRFTAALRLGNRFSVGYLNALSPSCMTVEGFTSLAAKQLGHIASVLDSQQGLTPLEQIVADLLDQNKAPVLCIDGFDAFATRSAFDEHFYGGLRALAQAGLCLVTTSKQQLVDIVVKGSRLSSLINVFDPIILTPFTKREATTFVMDKGRAAGFSEQECHYLLQYGQEGDSWPPARLQLAGGMMAEDKQWEDYFPDDAQYWRQFAERLETRYRGVLHQ